MSADSPPPSDKEQLEFLVVGRIARSYGYRGQMLLDPMTDFPDRFRPGLVIHIGESLRPYKLLAVIQHGRHQLITLEGIASQIEADSLINHLVRVPTSQAVPLPEGQYYWHQIIGLRAVLEDGKAIGEVSEIIRTKANDVYLVRTLDGKELLLPAIEDVVLRIDLAAGSMVVRPMAEY